MPVTDAAMEMVREIEEDTVDFRPTYDGESTEPCLYYWLDAEFAGEWNYRHSCWDGNKYEA